VGWIGEASREICIYNTPVSQVFSIAPWECEKKLAERTWKQRNVNGTQKQKTLTIKMRLGSQCEKVLQIPIQHGLFHFDWHFPMMFTLFSFKHEYVKAKITQQTRDINNSKACKHTIRTKQNWVENTKTVDYQDAVRFTTLENIANTNIYQYKTALSHFDWRFPMSLAIFSHKPGKSMNNSRIEANEECILYFNLNGRKQIVRQTWSCQDNTRCSKMCKLPQRKHYFQHFHSTTYMMYRRT